MPALTSIIDAVATPPLAAMQQVLDTNGPYTAGTHTLTQFVTNGAFLLPAGTYNVSGTYGVIVSQVGAIPAGLGYRIGWTDPTGNYNESNYQQRMAQMVVQHQLPITGAWVTTDSVDCYTVSRLILWQGLVNAPGRVGIYVAPFLSFDLYYLCVL